MRCFWYAAILRATGSLRSKARWVIDTRKSFSLSSSSKARWHLAQKSSDFSQVTACGVPKCTSVLIGKPRTRNARFSRVSGSHCSSEDVGFAQRAKPGIVMSGRHPLIKCCFNAPACETKQCSASRRLPANTGALGLRCAKEHRAAIVKCADGGPAWIRDVVRHLRDKDGRALRRRSCLKPADESHLAH